ncbi:MAG: M20/M25/M40 family metallo-hydrolase [Solirubrobacteraceae bacterium]|nr:M20/M25/M40 family metallo-hydrolase [Solirubrobacteraceae bacterium]
MTADHPPLTGEAPRVATITERLLGPLVDVSSPSGDAAALERCVDIVVDALPRDARVERLPCSTPGFAPDLLATVTGTGEGRIVLLGHLDTVVPHERHRPLHRHGDRWDGPGTFDMKAGDALAVGVLDAIADRRAAFGEVALLLVADEEWREAPFAHGSRFDGWDACLCFEGGERDAAGRDAVVVRRKAAATVLVTGRGRAAHAGSRPDDGRNALLALARVAGTLAAHHAPDGPSALSAVPTVLHAGSGINVVPGHGELVCDVRADDAAAIERVLASVPTEIEGVGLDARFGRMWPAMDHRVAAAPLLEGAADRLGRPIVPSSRGGASDASHLASHVAASIDGLGPLGGGAHADDEHVDRASFVGRAEVALAVAAATLGTA